MNNNIDEMVTALAIVQKRNTFFAKASLENLI